jgi:hypothetical protein
MSKALGIDVSKDTLDFCLLNQNIPFYNKYLNNDGIGSVC